ncbi:MAG: hypothetical protein M1834_003708 [Cirrosporium novae-zelandiae]|nr:MAG: hypothetical protein M1834_003708 [Cirrosporium novae-zelandiae]
MASTSPAGLISQSFPIVWKSSNKQAYEQARIGRVFNHRRPDRYPVAVVEANKFSDIINAVKLAIERRCRISIRSGGHSWAAWSVRDEAILIDFGKYNEVSLDEARRIVSVSPSTTGRVLNGYLSKFGLLFAGGHCPDVGVGGFLLQGGMGWNCRNWGWACEQVAAIDVVTAEGKLLHCSEDVNSDLLWAARGAGPGFPAIVTRFYLKVRPAPKVMRSSAYIYPMSAYKEAFSWIIDITPSYDTDTEIVAVGNYPPGMDEPYIMVLFVTFKDSERDAKQALQPAEDNHPPNPAVQWFFKETSLPQEYDDQGRANPNEHRYVTENAYINNDADVPEVLRKAFTTLPTKQSFALWYAMNPCSRRKLPDMALSVQSDHYFAFYGVWKDQADDNRCQTWTKETMKEIERHSVGAYLGDSDFQVRKTRYWGKEQGKKLMELRRKWDPEGRICGYLDEGDRSRQRGLANVHEWEEEAKGAKL